MYSTELITFLDQPNGLQLLKRAIAAPVAIFRSALKIRGSSAPVELTMQNTSISIKAKHVRRLCEWYRAGDIDGVEIEYIASALTLCPDFVPESENIKSALYGLSELCQADDEGARVLEIYKEVGGDEKYGEGKLSRPRGQ
jgi:hypothetical protein